MEENNGVQLPKPNISDIKNKQRRQELYIEMKREKRKLKLKEKKRKKKEAEELGDEAPPKQIPGLLKILVCMMRLWLILMMKKWQQMKQMMKLLHTSTELQLLKSFLQQHSKYHLEPTNSARNSGELFQTVI